MSGVVNKEGVACTRKAKTEKKAYSVNSFRACAVNVSLQWLTVVCRLSEAVNWTGDDVYARVL